MIVRTFSGQDKKNHVKMIKHPQSMFIWSISPIIINYLSQEDAIFDEFGLGNALTEGLGVEPMEMTPFNCVWQMSHYYIKLDIPLL